MIKLNFKDIAVNGNQTGKTIYVAQGDHTMGLIMPESTNMTLLSCRVTKGSPYELWDGFTSLSNVLSNKGKLRVASIEDFDYFRQSYDPKYFTEEETIIAR